jgi:CBS domain containing-hemolysin-like protein
MNESESDHTAEEENPRDSTRSSGSKSDASLGGIIRSAMRRFGLVRESETAVRDTLDDLIEEAGTENEEPLGEDERMLLANILSVRDRSVDDVMVPRADIVAVEKEAALADVIDVITSSGHSRLPVYRETLDDAIGMVHIKDVLAWRGRDSQFQLSNVLHPVLFVAPSMQVLQLLLEMRASRTHMALVVDEFGGVDGLITIEDLVEEIVGEIADEHDKADQPVLRQLPDGSLEADARVPLGTLEEQVGDLLSAEEREEIETLGGLVVSLAGRVPIPGELVRHPSGLEFEVLDADPRRITHVKVRHQDIALKHLTPNSAAQAAEPR